MSFKKLLALLLALAMLVCCFAACGSSDDEEEEDEDEKVEENADDEKDEDDEKDDGGAGENSDEDAGEVKFVDVEGTWTGKMDYTIFLYGDYDTTADYENKPYVDVEMEIDNDTIKIKVQPMEDEVGVPFFIELYEEYYGIEITEDEAKNEVADVNRGLPITLKREFSDFDGSVFTIDDDEFEVEVDGDELTVVSFSNSSNMLSYIVGVTFEKN